MADECKDCVYFQIHVTKTGDGDCLRYPPTVIPQSDSNNLSMMFPTVYNAQWCGEYVLKVP